MIEKSSYYKSTDLFDPIKKRKANYLELLNYMQNPTGDNESEDQVYVSPLS